MGLFLVTFCVMALAVAGMAVGVMFGMSPIAGSCGGLNAADGSCQSCSRPCKAKRDANHASVESGAQSDAQPLTRSDIRMTQQNRKP